MIFAAIFASLVLSLESPSEYHNITPNATNGFEGVAIVDGTRGKRLRQEDICFMREAAKERCNVADYMNTEVYASAVAGGDDGTILASEVNTAWANLSSSLGYPARYLEDVSGAVATAVVEADGFADVDALLAVAYGETTPTDFDVESVAAGGSIAETNITHYFDALAPFKWLAKPMKQMRTTSGGEDTLIIDRRGEDCFTRMVDIDAFDHIPSASFNWQTMQFDLIDITKCETNVTASAAPDEAFSPYILRQVECHKEAESAFVRSGNEMVRVGTNICAWTKAKNETNIGNGTSYILALPPDMGAFSVADAWLCVSVKREDVLGRYGGGSSEVLTNETKRILIKCNVAAGTRDGVPTANITVPSLNSIEATAMELTGLTPASQEYAAEITPDVIPATSAVLAASSVVVIANYATCALTTTIEGAFVVFKVAGKFYARLIEL